MATWIWILIGLGIVVLLAVLAFGGRRTQQRRLGQRRAEAEKLRREATIHDRRADEREAVAREHAEQAQLERKQAAAVSQRAAHVDPDRDE
jgi:Tfp pilus assembly protein PilN